MNIGLFTDCYLPTKNGVSTAIAQARQELARRGHKVVTFTVAGPGAAGQEPLVHRFPSLPFNPEIEIRLGVTRQAAIDRVVAREQIEIIHTHTEFSLGWAGKRAAGRAGLPRVHTLHTLYPAYRHYLPLLGRLLPDRAIGALLARLLAGCDAVICPSEKVRAYAAGLGPALRTIVLGNGASSERFNPECVTAARRDALRAALGLTPADRVILYAGRLAQEKRVLALLEALLPLLRARADCRAVFVGAGEAGAALAAAGRAAGCGRQVVLAGPVEWEQMAEIYALAHAFVTVSLSEVHPMTLIEAMTCGLPIVARRDISLLDLVRDGYNGLLADADAEIAGKLAAILQDEAVRQTFARNARAHAAQFTIEAHVDRLERLYRQIITASRGEVFQ